MWRSYPSNSSGSNESSIAPFLSRGSSTLPFFFGGFGQGGCFDAHCAHRLQCFMRQGLPVHFERVSRGVVALYAALCLMDLRASFEGSRWVHVIFPPVRTNQLMPWHSATVEFLQHQCLASVYPSKSGLAPCNPMPTLAAGGTFQSPLHVLLQAKTF